MLTLSCTWSAEASDVPDIILVFIYEGVAGMKVMLLFRLKLLLMSLCGTFIIVFLRRIGRIDGAGSY